MSKEARPHSLALIPYVTLEQTIWENNIKRQDCKTDRTNE